MNIIGIYTGHCATACVLSDGKIIAAASEEKFDNIKNSMGIPLNAIKWCLTHPVVTEKGLDAVAISGKTGIVPFQDVIAGSQNNDIIQNLKEWLKKISSKFDTESILNKIIFKLREKSLEISAYHARNQIFDMCRELALGLTEDRIQFIDHHTCHAYSAYYAMRKNKGNALVFTLDGYGDWLCATVNKVEDGRIERISSTNWLSSLGSIYSFVTKYLGMKMMEHEYKVMGLSPYAKEYFKDTYEKLFKPVLFIDRENPLVFKSKVPPQSFYYYLVKNAHGIRFDNIAGAVQHLTEELITEWIRNAIKMTGIRTIYCGGGVFMNVKANLKIIEMPEVEEAHFLPSCGDESTPFGAALYVYKQLTGKDPEPSFENIYFGMEYSNDEVKRFIEEKGIDKKYKVQFFDDIEKEIARLLAQFKVVARFKGRAEWGARALGSRSILANPSDMKSFYEVNDQIKCRDFWMPFAPSILDEDADKYIINPKRIEAPYMILAFHSTSLAQEHLKAAMHQGDKTLRPQIVTEKANPSYYRLIRYFKELTGIGGVMNTSLNLHGYPLVGTFEQALFTLENSGLKYMAVENWLVSKL